MITHTVRRLTDTADTLTWVLSDHLGSASTTANENGTLNSVIQYTAFGEIRLTQGLTPTKYRYTGQLAQAELGLDFYVSRMYDPLLSHFVQADTVIPNPADTKALDRFAYANNNPLIYIDPNGHQGILIVIAAVLLLVISGDSGLQNVNEQEKQTENYNKCKETYGEIERTSTSSGEAIERMFATNQFPGESASERFESIMTGAASEPYQYMAGDFSDTGFKEEFRDGGDQVGHFLQATSLSYSSEGEIGEYFAKSVIIGHEMVSDPQSERAEKYLGFVNQTSASLFRPYTHEEFNSGKDSEFMKILYEMGDPSSRRGNSIQDLRLSKKGWEFGKLLKEKKWTRDDANKWLKENVLE